MKKLQNGFSTLVVIIIVIIFLAIFAGIISITKQSPFYTPKASPVQSTHNQVTQPKQVLKIIPSETVSTSPLTLNGDTDLNGKVGERFNYNFTSDGGLPPYHYKLDSGIGFPPMGIILDTNGNLSGTPSASGNSTFGVCVVDTAGKNKCENINLNVDPADVVVSPVPEVQPSINITSVSCGDDNAIVSGTASGNVGAEITTVRDAMTNCGNWENSISCYRKDGQPAQTTFSVTLDRFNIVIYLHTAGAGGGMSEDKVLTATAPDCQ